MWLASRFSSAFLEVKKAEEARNSLRGRRIFGEDVLEVLNLPQKKHYNGCCWLLGTPSQLFNVWI